ncbi:MAG TPA: DUF1667 domain-containing protein [Clostridia bacterium]
MNEFVCIKCPMSCKLKVFSNKDNITVQGNNCKRGELFGIQEFTAPKRTVTSLVKVIGGDKPVLPVKTSSPIPKEHVKIVLNKISKISISAPISIGDVVFKEIDEGVDLIATSNTLRISN